MRPLIAFALVFSGTAVAGAEPYRLRADALTSTPSPMGLVVLTGEAHPLSWVRAEAVIWGGSGDDTADALVALIRLRDPGNRGDLTLGRFVLATGAVRPIHLDGGWLRLKLPAGLGLEVFGGRPVQSVSSWNGDPQTDGGSAKFERDEWDWAAGARVSETLAGRLGAGVSFIERREYGDVSDREAGANLWLAPTDRLDLASRFSWDLVMEGISEAGVSAAYRASSFRFELFGTRRSPAKLLPATSIFSALGDVPSDTAGCSATWYAAPRLDVFASGAARWAGDMQIEQDSSDEVRPASSNLGMDGSVRATLRLDDEGQGQLALEARRFGLSPGEWTGLRLRLRVPVILDLALATELELAVPDHHVQGRGKVWPWGLVSFGGHIADRWEAGVAVEAFASPEKAHEVSALARLAYRWEGP